MKQFIKVHALVRTTALLLTALLLAPLAGWPDALGGRSVSAQTTLQGVTDGFDYPVGKPNGAGWSMSQGFGGSSNHAGEDWVTGSWNTANKPVYAVANGIVRSAAFYNYPGGVVIIEHTLPNGETWYSMYGHVNSGVSVGQSVSRGQQIATIYYQTRVINGRTYDNAHLHFEIRNFHTRSEVNGDKSACAHHYKYPPGPGYWPVCGGSGSIAGKGWVNPSQFINVRRSQNTLAVGLGSSRQTTFQRAYDATKTGTLYNVNYGQPTGSTYWAHLVDGSDVVRQDFSNDVTLAHDENADRPIRSVPAYPVYGAIKGYWLANSWLGAPTSNPVKNGSEQLEQHFRYGWVKSSGGSTWSGRWPTTNDCISQGKWRLEVINLFHFEQGVGPAVGITWPPDQPLRAGPSLVACVAAQQPGYALFYDRGLESPYFERSTYDQGLWKDHWMARLSGKIRGLPSNGFYQVSAACDDGCDIQFKSTAYSWWTQRILSWHDQPAMHLGTAWVQNGDQVNIAWYEHQGAARVWLKLGTSALALPPLAAQCDAYIALADGAPVTNTLAQTLTINATNAAEMKIGRLADLSDASWQPYTTTLPIQLAPGNSVITRTVYAQFRDMSEQTLCQGAILADEIVLDTLAPTGTAAIETNDVLSATLQLVANDQPDGSGVAGVAVLLIRPNQPASDPATLSEDMWQAYNSTITITKPMIFEANDPAAQMEPGLPGDLTYQIWLRDAAGNIAEPMTVTVPFVEAPLTDTTLRIYLPTIMNV